MLRLLGARGRIVLVLMMLAMLVGIAAGLYAAEMLKPSARKIPGTVDLTKMKFDIVDVEYVTYLESVNNKVFETQVPDKYRGAVVTLQVTKPADMPVTLMAQDFSIHYYYGNETDAAICHGLSTFSTDIDDDRDMSLFPISWGTQTTGRATTRATTVYIDMFIQNIEPNVSDLFLVVGQPVGASMVTTGWRP